jgi:uncharacterized membrane protein YgaE (UPF0421/DUF939 family)
MQRDYYFMAIRAGLGCLMGALLSIRLGYPEPIFAIIATVLVTDFDPKVTQRSGIQRIIGTLLGAVVGIAFDVMGKGNVFSLMIAVTAAMSLCALVRLKEGYRIAGYMAGILIYLDHSLMWAYALRNVIETFSGVIAAILISYVPRLIKAYRPQLAKT